MKQIIMGKNINYQSSREDVLEAVKNDGYALYFATEEQKADREIVLAAVGSKGDTLFSASKEMNLLIKSR